MIEVISEITEDVKTIKKMTKQDDQGADERLRDARY